MTSRRSDPRHTGRRAAPGVVEAVAPGSDARDVDRGEAPDADASDAEASEAPDAPDVEQRQWRVDAPAHGQRIDRVLATLAGEFSRNHLQSVIAQGHVQLDGAVVQAASRRVRAGQLLQVALWPTAQALAFRPEPIALAVVFEDEHLLVLDKPAGLVVHPAAGNWSGTLLNGLLAHHAAAAMLPRAGIVHRLDKDTSGLMVVAKTLPAMTALVRAIAAREVQRIYQALVHGVPAWSGLAIDAPIGRDPRLRTRMAVVPGGKPARTDVVCLARGAVAAGLRCTLHSGRTHQIRVHLAARGHPLVGDALYGGEPAFGLQRQALHAVQLGFAHPIGGQRVTFHSSLPADLASAWRAALKD
ncbi:MAG: RluA family pseudouridine synthase [Ideonella sp.]|nr:RluA family pseudouridine synthase [Ideonella sp.]MCC7459452.1 RluA family pseudouridine synthase [Nitrospira sp.]